MKTALLVATLALFVLLGIRPKADRLTWFLENLPVIVAILQPTFFLGTASAQTIRTATILSMSQHSNQFQSRASMPLMRDIKAYLGSPGADRADRISISPIPLWFQPSCRSREKHLSIESRNFSFYRLEVTMQFFPDDILFSRGGERRQVTPPALQAVQEEAPIE